MCKTLDLTQTNTEDLLRIPEKELLTHLNTSLSGLPSEEAKKRLKTYGYNEIAKKKKKIGS